MFRRLVIAVLVAASPGLAFAQACLAPEEPYPYDPPADPKLRALVNEQYGEYMEQVEDYLNCMQIETARAHHEARLIMDRWIRYFGDEAGIKIDARSQDQTTAPEDVAPKD